MMIAMSLNGSFSDQELAPQLSTRLGHVQENQEHAEHEGDVENTGLR